ncbi:YceD family protein [Frateuria aurantia]
MSVTLPVSVDVWRMITARRSFEGKLPIARMKRLAEALASADGEVEYALDFGTDDLGLAYIALRALAPLTLICQRNLEPFVFPLQIDTRLGVIRSEREEAALPEGYEPLLVNEDGRLSPADVIEDELLLGLPLVPVNPESELPDEVMVSEVADEVATEPEDNPFAVLRELKKH